MTNAHLHQKLACAILQALLDAWPPFLPKSISIALLCRLQQFWLPFLSDVIEALHVSRQAACVVPQAFLTY